MKDGMGSSGLSFSARLCRGEWREVMIGRFKCRFSIEGHFQQIIVVREYVILLARYFVVLSVWCPRTRDKRSVGVSLASGCSVLMDDVQNWNGYERVSLLKLTARRRCDLNSDHPTDTLFRVGCSDLIAINSGILIKLISLFTLS